MREILFRGKRIDNDEWAVGDLLVSDIDGKVAIRDRNTLEVLLVFSETVGEYTGLKDLNGKKIFEGDIVKLFDEYVAVIIFESAMFLVKCEGINFQFSQEDSPDIEVIGTIHDNPEFLEKGVIYDIARESDSDSLHGNCIR